MLNIQFERRSDKVNALAFYNRDTWIAAGLSTGEIHLWDYGKNALVVSFLAHHDGEDKKTGSAASQVSASLVHSGVPCWCLDFHPTDPLLVTGGDDRKMKFWKIEEAGERCVLSFDAHKDTVKAVQFHPDPSVPWVVSGGFDGQLFVWDYRRRVCIHTMTHNNAVFSVAFHPTRNLIASASKDTSVRVWDTSGLLQGQADATTRRNEVDIEKGTSGALVTLLRLLQAHSLRGIQWATFHPSLPIMASAGEDRRVRLYRLDSGAPIKAQKGSLCGHQNFVTCCIFHPKIEHLLVSCSEDCSMILWDTKENKPIQEVRSTENDDIRFWSLAMNKRDGLMAAGHDNGMFVFEWNKDDDGDDYDDDGDKKKDCTSSFCGPSGRVNTFWKCEPVHYGGQRALEVEDPYALEHARQEEHFFRKRRRGRFGFQCYLCCCFLFGPIGVLILLVYSHIVKRRQRSEEPAGMASPPNSSIV